MTSIETRTPEVSLVVVRSDDTVADRAARTATDAAVADLQPYLEEPVEVVEVVASATMPALALTDALGAARGSIVVVVDRHTLLGPGALGALVVAVASAEAPTLALPLSWPSPCAALPQSLVDALAGAVGQAEDLTAAVGRLIDDGVPWVAALGAETTDAPRRPGPRVIRPAPRTVIPPAWTPEAIGRHLDVANPDAVTVGVETYFQPGSLVKTYWPTERVHIGSYCCIAAEVHLVHGGAPLRTRDGQVVPTRLLHSHHPATATSFPIDRLLPDDAKPFDQGPFDGSLTSRPLVIGSDVWLGYRATVYGPVTVGHGAIVGVGAVVVGDVPPYAVVAGNPATVVRMRFSPPVVERLLAVAWWEWPPELVRERWEWFTKPIAQFLSLAEG